MKKKALVVFPFFLTACLSCEERIHGKPDFTTNKELQCYIINNSVVYASPRYNEVAVPIFGGSGEPVFEADIIEDKRSLRLGTGPIGPLGNLCFTDKGNLANEVKNMLRFYEKHGFIDADNPVTFAWESGAWVIYYDITKDDVDGYFRIIIDPDIQPKNEPAAFPETKPLQTSFVSKGIFRLNMFLGDKIPERIRRLPP